MRTSKKLLLGLAVLAVSVTGMQGQECKVCVRDPLGLSEECWDVRLDDDLRLLFAREEYVIRGESTNRWIKVSHSGARFQWSANSIDWNLFNHCKGVGIQPNIGDFTFTFSVGFPIGGRINPCLIGSLEFEGCVAPDITKFFIRLLPCDVNAHKEAYKNRKIEIETWMSTSSRKSLYTNEVNRRNDFYDINGYDFLMASGLWIRVKWNYGVLQFSRSLNPKDVKWERRGRIGGGVEKFKPQGYHLYDDDPRFDRKDGHYKYGFGAFFRIKPIDENAFKTFYIDLDEDMIREEKPVSNIPVLTPPLDLK